MKAPLYILPILGCGGMMVICMALMARGMRSHKSNQRTDTTSAAPEVSAELDKLREERTYEEQLKKVRAPIGLDIGAVSPEEVALAILSEIVAERRGGSGLPLSSWRRKFWRSAESEDFGCVILYVYHIIYIQCNKKMKNL